MAPAIMRVTVAGAGDKSGSSWANAMGWAEFETDYEGSAESGDMYYVMSGTYTLTSHLSTAIDGTSTDMIQVIGVSDEALTEAVGADRPFFDGGASYYVRADNWWRFRNVRVEGEQAYVLRADTGAQFINCKADNSSGTADRDAIRPEGANCIVIKCEAISDAGVGIFMFSRYGIVRQNHAHDCKTGIRIIERNAVEENIIETCTTYGLFIDTSTLDFNYIVNNTIWTCATGINAPAGYDYLVADNLIDTNTTKGIVWAAAIDSAWFDYNNFNGNSGGDVTNVTKGPNTTSNVPGFTNAAGQDFSGVDAANGSVIEDGVG